MKVGMSLRYITLAVLCCIMMTGCQKCKSRRAGAGAGTGGDVASGNVVDNAGGGPGSLGSRPDGGIPTAGMFPAVQFAYDSAAINPSEQSKLQAVADSMKSNPGVKLLVEGHCDERGTAEYNRALGERRALATREALIGVGVDGSSIQTISYGKDKPLVATHDESSWAKNRRAEFVVLK